MNQEKADEIRALVATMEDLDARWRAASARFDELDCDHKNPDGTRALKGRFDDECGICGEIA